MHNKHLTVNELPKRGGTDLGTGKHCQEAKVAPLDPKREIRLKRHPERRKFGAKGY